VGKAPRDEGSLENFAFYVDAADCDVNYWSDFYLLAWDQPQTGQT
jgi:hypothetical protein